MGVALLAETEAANSTPSLSEFDPTVIPYQFQVIQDVRQNWDYSNGTVHEFMLSGSVGSAKSILLAHLGITHCLQFERARLVLGRQAMPDLKDTILKKVLEHMEGDLEEGEDYEHNEQKGMIEFSNGSEVISRSWADKKFKSKFRSVEASAAIIEELTENDEAYKAFYPELRMRVGRLPHVPESWIGCATNPDSPAHWAHKHFIESTAPTRHVYYSVTTDNPFLPPNYVTQLLNDLDAKLARRMIYGKWVEIGSEVIYHAYSREKNYRDEDYKINPAHAIRICHDFNIGEGKPMSACAAQYVGDTFHWFDEWVVEGADTWAIMEEIAGSGLFEHRTKFLIHGDASGRHKDTRSKRTDYDIIRNFLANFRREDGSPIDFEIEVPISNPPVRTRHNKMNAYMGNALGDVRFFVYRGAPKLDEGLRLTKLKPNGLYVEDDTPAYQHVTTAAGYGLMWAITASSRKSNSYTR